MEGNVRGHNILEWKVIEPLREKTGAIFTSLDEFTLNLIRRQYQDDPFAHIPVTIRIGDALQPEEIAYQRARRPKVKAALEEWLGMRLSDEEMPVIALCSSGGGLRSALGTAGSFWGAGKLEQATFYVSAFSGGTWFLGPYIASGLTASEFAQQFPDKIKSSLLLGFDPVELAKMVLVRYAFHQPISLVNIFGLLLSRQILTGLPHGPYKTFLYDQAELIKNGDTIFPIYVAVLTKLPYQWIEFTPFEVAGVGAHIPVWAFGAPFQNGSLVYYTPPFNLGYILAIAGSAFCSSLNRYHEKICRQHSGCVYTCCIAHRN